MSALNLRLGVHAVGAATSCPPAAWGQGTNPRDSRMHGKTLRGSIHDSCATCGWTRSVSKLQLAEIDATAAMKIGSVLPSLSLSDLPSSLLGPEPSASNASLERLRGMPTRMPGPELRTRRLEPLGGFQEAVRCARPTLCTERRMRPLPACSRPVYHSAACSVTCIRCLWRVCDRRCAPAAPPLLCRHPPG